MGTMIYSQGGDFEQCFDMLSITHPQVLVQIHRMYAEAGADILETDTFGANRYRMDVWGVADQVREANHRAVSLAKQVAKESDRGREVFVAASVGPLGVRLSPLGNVSPMMPTPPSLSKSRRLLRPVQMPFFSKRSRISVRLSRPSVRPNRSAICPLSPT